MKNLSNLYIGLLACCWSSIALGAKFLDVNVNQLVTYETISKPKPSGELATRDETLTSYLYRYRLRCMVNVTIGTPPQKFSLLLDTASSDLWVPAIDSSTCQNNRTNCDTFGAFSANASLTVGNVRPDALQLGYQNTNTVSGDWLEDTVRIGRANITTYNLGVARQIKSSNTFSGVLGLSWPQNEQSPTQYDNFLPSLLKTGVIDSLSYSLWLTGSGPSPSSILFGGLDTTKFVAPLQIHPIVLDPSVSNQSRNKSHLPIDLRALSVTENERSSNVFSAKLPIYVDTGSFLSFLPMRIIEPLFTATSARYNKTSGHSTIPCSQGLSPTELVFGFGGTANEGIKVPIKNFIYTNDDIEGTGDPYELEGGRCFFSIVPLAARDSRALLGDGFFKSTYVVVDMTSGNIGLAPIVSEPGNSTNIVEIPADGGIVGLEL